jgi:X-Pro dipeptidyl-peptidase
MGEDVDVLYDFVHSGPPDRRAWCNQNVRDGEMARGQDRETGDYNAFWKSRDYWHQLGGVNAATMLAHGLNDWNVMPLHSVRVYETLKQRGVPARIFLHQGGHGGEPPFEHMNRWFTRYLFGIENGVESEPRAWIVREDAHRAEPTPYADYPNPDARLVALHPGPGGAARGALSLEPIPRAGRETFVDDASVTGTDLAKAEASKNRLLFQTPELSEPVHLSGTPRVALRIAADRPAANLSVWLVSLPWQEGEKVKIHANVITRGWADPQNAASIEEGEPLVPGEFRDVVFELEPDDQIVAKGERIALVVFSSDHDFTLWPAPGTELTLDLDASLVELPVVGGADALRRALGGAAR